jgi:hypothetical protein
MQMESKSNTESPIFVGANGPTNNQNQAPVQPSVQALGQPSVQNPVPIIQNQVSMRPLVPAFGLSSIQNHVSGQPSVQALGQQSVVPNQLRSLSQPNILHHPNVNTVQSGIQVSVFSLIPSILPLPVRSPNNQSPVRIQVGESNVQPRPSVPIPKQEYYIKSNLKNKIDNIKFIGKDDDIKISIPNGYLCSISMCIYIDPVIAADGHTYEREEIEKWFQSHNTSPKENTPVMHKNLSPNKTLKSVIGGFLDTNPAIKWSNHIYLSLNLANRFRNAIYNGNLKDFESCVDMDPRLLYSIEFNDNWTFFYQVVNFGIPAIIERYFIRLGDKLDQVPDIIKIGKITILMHVISIKRDPIAIDVIMKHLKLQDIEYFECAKRSLSHNDCEILKACFKYCPRLNQLTEKNTQNTLAHLSAVERNINSNTILILIQNKVDFRKTNAANRTAEDEAKYAVNNNWSYVFGDAIMQYKIQNCSYMKNFAGYVPKLNSQLSKALNEIEELKKEIKEIKSEIESHEGSINDIIDDLPANKRRKYK